MAAAPLEALMARLQLDVRCLGVGRPDGPTSGPVLSVESGERFKVLAIFFAPGRLAVAK